LCGLLVRGFAECRYVRQKEVRKVRKETIEKYWERKEKGHDEKDRTLGGERTEIRERTRQ
jgi:hypothetical protein